MKTAYIGAEIFDGTTRWQDHALIVEGARVVGVTEDTGGARVVQLDGGLLCPGFVDLQVNGGGGLLFNDAPSPEALEVMARAHGALGATSILPTLITDSPEKTAQAIEAVAEARVDGILGLHLEGPHLALPRKGAHDGALIRPMEDTDLAVLLDAAQRLPMLKVTLAPEAVKLAQIKALARAGVLISLGHSDAPYELCEAATAAGARCVTHLFNAMSQLGSRAPGLVGAALHVGALSTGLIADGVHVHPATVTAALAAKRGPGQVFLVSDAMAVAGSDLTEFTLAGRRVIRAGGRLTLEDGTLAGADLDLLRAVRNLVEWGAATEDEALSMATSRPADLCPNGADIGRLTPGAKADFLHILPGQSAAVWRAGTRVA